MANTIKQKRGTTDPGASDLVVGELAINTTDGGVFTKTDGGTVVEVGSSGGASAINDLSDAVTSNSGKNIGLGTGALANDDGTNFNTALGYNALNANTTGAANTALGYQALYSNTTATTNVAVGSFCLYSNTTGAYNTAMGWSALTSSTTGYYHTAVGYEALRLNTTGQSCSAFGWRALRANTTGERSTAVGYEALKSNTTGQDNSAFGYQALTSFTTGSSLSGKNTGLGYRAGYDLTTGYTNTFVGALAGNTTTTGYNNICIGYDAEASSATVSNEITLGDLNITSFRIPGIDLEAESGVLNIKNGGTQSEVRWYCESSNAHYAAIKAPAHSDFSGNITFTLPATTGSNGQVLSTDGSGALSWVNQSSGGGGITDGDKGDITVSNSGGTFTIDDDVVTAAKLADTAVTAGSYTSADITVDAQGRITAASNGSGGGGSGGLSRAQVTAVALIFS